MSVQITVCLALITGSPHVSRFVFVKMRELTRALACGLIASVGSTLGVFDDARTRCTTSFHRVIVVETITARSTIIVWIQALAFAGGTRVTFV